ncbi:MAG TPA: UvrD-helicase domain-containing protein, partial [Miltoncostaea sp.]|nr:UvrD-helicase domain-containing protein [Miltoncostaea sp.]
MSADAAAREAIAGHLGATMLVEAGAGTGKTRALVDRVVGLVAAGTRIERIAAITFTERAAAELRERVRTGLDDRIADPATGEEVRERYRVARDDLDRAQLSTIHAFGQALLRSLCAEAGIDPEIAVLDQLTADRRFEERWRAALEEVDPAADDGRAIDRALGLGLRIKDLKRLGEALTERADIAARILRDPPAAPAPDWSVLADHHDRLRGLPLDRVLGDDKLLAHIGELLVLF